MGEWSETIGLSCLRSDEEAARVATGIFRSCSAQDESYGQKWKYVQENPVRAGLVQRPDQWRYQGEFVLIDRD